MNVELDASALRAALDGAHRIAARGAVSAPVTTCVLLSAHDGGRLTAAATDLDVSMVREVEAKVVCAGAGVCIDARRLQAIASQLPADARVGLTVDERDYLHLRCVTTAMSLPGIRHDEFPSLPAGMSGDSDGYVCTVPLESLKGLIARSEFAITGNDARYYLAGALLAIRDGRFDMVATDGHRMAFVTEPHEFDGEVQPRSLLLPKKLLLEVARMAASTVDIYADATHIVLRSQDVSIATRTIDAQFPSYEALVAAPKAHGAIDVTIRAASLMAALSRVAVCASKDGKPILLECGTGCMTVKAASPDAGEASEVVDAEHAATDSRCVSANSQYILDFLASTRSADVVVSIGGPDERMVFTRPGSDDVYIVMPMRV